MNLADVMDEIARRLDNISGLRVYSWPTDKFTPPAAIISYPEEIQFDQTYRRGVDKLTIPIMVFVPRANAHAAKTLLTQYCDGSGPNSIKSVVESGDTDHFDDLTVTRAEFDVFKVAGVEYFTVQFDADVTGSGSP